MRPRWRKVFADLWDNKARTLLVVISIAVGVFAVGMIAGAYVIIPDAMNGSYAAANPANIVIRTDPFEKGFTKAIQRVAGVADAEGRRAVTVRLRTGSDTWGSLDLFALPDLAEMQIDRLLLLQGNLQPAGREVLLLDKTAQKHGLSVGEQIEIELPDGTLRMLRVAGVVKDLTAGTNGFMADGIGYIAFGTLEWLHQPFEADRLYVTVTERPNDKAYIQSVAAQVTDRLEKSGRKVYETQLYEKNKHPLSSIITAVLGILGALGVLLVFLSGALIANTLSALLSQHLRQIGVMKLIGARRSQIIGMYLTLILTFGMLALALSAPLAGWAAYALAQIVADLIVFILPPTPLVPLIPFAVLVQVVMALVIPLVAGIWPVLSGSRVTVQKAISSVGLSVERPQTSWLNRQAARLRWPRLLSRSRPLLISIRNTFRRKGRLALTLVTLTLGGAIFIAVFNVRSALNLTVARSTQYFRADVNLNFNGLYPIAEIEPLALTVPGVEHVEAWASTRAQWLRGDGTAQGNVTLLAPPAGSSLVEPLLLAGRWLLPGDENAITVNEAFWGEYPHLRPGDKLRLKINDKEADWTVVGIFQFTGADELFAYTNYDYLSGLLHQSQRAALYRIVTRDHSLAYQKQLSVQLDEYFKGLGFHVGNVEAGGTLTKTITDLLGILVLVLLIMALLTAVVGSIGLAGTLSMNVLERTREIGVMRAVGAYNEVILKLVIVEGLLIGLISFVLGAALSFPISTMLANIVTQAIFKTSASATFTLQGFAIWLAVVIFLAVLASVIPARNASRLTIREVLAYE
jgi:putative ABC transport system permease protein